MRQEAPLPYAPRSVLRFPTTLAALALVAACGRADEEAPRVDAADAVVTLPAAAGRPGAAYFRLEANVPVTLRSIESRRAERIEMHEPGMRRVESIRLVPGEPLAFSPGSRHAMLFGLDPTLRPGQTIALTLRFDGIHPLIVEAELRRAGDVHGGH